MSRSTFTNKPSGKGGTPRSTFLDRLKEIDMFFQKDAPVHHTMREIARQLEQAGIPYAVVGGMAVNAHNYQRTTNDLDLLLTRAGLAEFRKRMVPAQYDLVPGRGKRFVDRSNQVTIDILVTGFYPGNGEPGPISYPDPAEVARPMDDIQVVNLAWLIQLKLAARRYKDFADVVALLRVNGLDESFQDNLHPSVRPDFVECLEEMRREDEYEARSEVRMRELDEDSSGGSTEN